MIEYVYGRDQGEINQEVGGVMVTLAAHCLAHGIDMHEAAEAELARIWTKVDKIRAKQAAKPTGSALPVAAEHREPVDIGYTNWRGEYAVRRIIPVRVWFGSTDWHPAPQWMLTAIDVEKGAERDFAVADIGTRIA